MEFADALDAALDARGLSLAEVRQQLRHRGVSLSAATLSYWRSGARRPDPVRSASSVTALEAVLGISPGELSGRVTGHSRRLGAIGRVEPLDAAGSERSRMLRLLDVTPVENYRMLSIQETIDIDADLSIRSVEIALLVQCVHGSLETLGFVDIAPEPTTASPRLSVRAGGTADDVLIDEGGTVFGHRLTLARPLAPGETAMVEVRKTFPVAYPAQRSHLVVAPRRVRELLQWFRFAQGHPPDWFDEDETLRRTKTVTVADPASVLRARVDFGPGQLHARWGHIDDL